VIGVPREEAPAALDLPRQRIAREQATRERLAAGELGVDIYGLRATLEALGVEHRG